MAVRWDWKNFIKFAGALLYLINFAGAKVIIIIWHQVNAKPPADAGLLGDIINLVFRYLTWFSIKKNIVEYSGFVQNLSLHFSSLGVIHMKGYRLTKVWEGITGLCLSFCHINLWTSAPFHDPQASPGVGVEGGLLAAAKGLPSLPLQYAILP